MVLNERNLAKALLKGENAGKGRSASKPKQAKEINVVNMETFEDEEQRWNDSSRNDSLFEKSLVSNNLGASPNLIVAPMPDNRQSMPSTIKRPFVEKKQSQMKGESQPKDSSRCSSQLTNNDANPELILEGQAIYESPATAATQTLRRTFRK